MTDTSDWWDEYFDDDFVSIYRPFLTPGRTRREVRGVVELVALPAGARVLDLACGWGRHAVELARLGYEVTGLDWSDTLLNHARRRANRAGVAVEWVRGDMREIPWTGRFDAVLSMFSSLGYFLSDEEDLRTLQSARAALRDGGSLLLETMHRDHVVNEYVERDWWHAAKDRVVWVEREWDALAGISREILRWRRGDREGEKHHALRIRSATEWLVLLAEAGWGTVECYGNWAGAPFQHGSENLIMVASPSD